MENRLGKWIICPDCGGDGHHARHLGVINRDEWEDEEFEHYMHGDYDRICDNCGGGGKVREGAEPARRQPWWVNDPEAMAERRMGA
jgi:hypothetical protein